MGPSHMNMRIGIIGGNNRRKAPPRVTLDKATNYIKSRKYTSRVEQQLIRELSQCASGAYESYLKRLPERAMAITKKGE